MFDINKFYALYYGEWKTVYDIFNDPVDYEWIYRRISWLMYRCQWKYKTLHGFRTERNESFPGDDCCLTLLCKQTMKAYTSITFYLPNYRAQDLIIRTTGKKEDFFELLDFAYFGQSAYNSATFPVYIVIDGKDVTSQFYQIYGHLVNHGSSTINLSSYIGKLTREWDSHYKLPSSYLIK